MEKKDLRIVFMGTPDFAVGSLRRLVEGGYNIVGVVTATDKPVGRHRNTLVPSPVKEYALARNLPLLQPERLKDSGFLESLRALKADLQVVVAFRMLPEVVWGMPRLGTLNLHASLLPQYRGAAPINWAIINGESHSGVTTFFLQHEIDTGNVAMRRRVEIMPDDTAGDLHDKLMVTGAELLAETVDAIICGTVESMPQHTMETGGSLRTAPKIFTDTCRIDWTRTATEVNNFVRGLSPHPTAWTEVEHNGERLVMKIYTTRVADTKSGGAPGTLGISDNGKRLFATTAHGRVEILDLQISGKKRMTAASFLNGLHNAATLRIRL